MSNYVYRDVVPFPIEEKKNPLSGEWYDGVEGWALEDTCPECHHLQCDQVLDGKGKIDLYICSNCNHQWQPDSYVEVEIGHIVKRIEPVIVSSETVKTIQKSIEMKLIERWLYGL